MSCDQWVIEKVFSYEEWNKWRNIHWYWMNISSVTNNTDLWQSFRLFIFFFVYRRRITWSMITSILCIIQSLRRKMKKKERPKWLMRNCIFRHKNAHCNCNLKHFHSLSASIFIINWYLHVSPTAMCLWTSCFVRWSW